MQPRLLLSIIALATVSLIANAKAGDDHVKIGVLTDMNGPYAAITGKGSVAAAELAIEDFGGKTLGNSVELVSADHMQKPDIGAGIARKWYDNEGVDAIFDGPGSSVALATLEIARARNKIVAFSGVISPDVTGKLCGETISSWAWDTHAMVATSIKSLMKSGEKRFFFLTLDAAAGRALEVDDLRSSAKATLRAQLSPHTLTGARGFSFRTFPDRSPAHTQGDLLMKNGTKRRAWTSVQVRELKSMARKKTPASRIAKKLKRSEGATRQKAFSMGLSLDSRA